MRLRWWWLALLFCGISLTGAWADEKQDASDFANALGQKALTIIADKSHDEADRRGQLEALFAQNVDIDWIGKFVLGRFWRGATDEQKQQYLANYKTFLIKHYTSNLTDFGDAKFEVTHVVPDDNGGLVVSMHVKRPNAEDTNIDYTLRKADSSFKVYDIVVEGVSMITTQRSEFSSVASQKGLDYLIEELATRSKNDEPAPK